MKRKPKRKKASKCIKCDENYYIEYNNHIPIFVCKSCNHKDTTWEKFYEEYMELWKDKNSWAEKKNYISCILGFFCYMYKGFYNTEYIFIPSTPNPFTTKECRDANILLNSFSNNIEYVRKYIYWIFNKQITKTTNITSLGYLTTPALIRKFNLILEQKNKLNRFSKLPDILLNWCDINTPDIKQKYTLETMNDLAAMLSYIQSFGQTGCDSENKFINKATELQLIKNGKINIG